mmetsp:Transcript_31981/g.36369  ORF Transcript_31981/g.36369 Transcript_31981/m.36369 type:complete len:101 (+) Transcript_31981:28-330(+)
MNLWFVFAWLLEFATSFRKIIYSRCPCIYNKIKCLITAADPEGNRKKVPSEESKNQIPRIDESARSSLKPLSVRRSLENESKLRGVLKNVMLTHSPQFYS